MLKQRNGMDIKKSGDVNMVKEVRRTNFWWGVGVSALIFVIISVIVLTNYRLVKEQPVAQVSCDIQKQFSGCSDLLTKVDVREM